MKVDLNIPSLGNKFQDYRDDILGDSYNWGNPINAKEVTYFALHHSVTKQTAKNDGDWKKECDVIASLHVNGRGWGGIGYRFVICSDGTVAYVGDLSHGGSAVLNNNHKIFSACFVGDFTKELPTAAQIHSAHLLAKHFFFNMPQYPSLTGWEDLIGHQDAHALASELGLSGSNATTCPSPNWRNQADSLRQRVIDDRFQGYPDPQPTWSVTQPQPQPQPQPEPQPQPQPTDPCASVKEELENVKKELSAVKSDLSKETGKVQGLLDTITVKENEIRRLNGIIETFNLDSTELSRLKGVEAQAKSILTGRDYFWNKLRKLRQLFNV